MIPLGSVGFLRKGSESNDENGDPSDSEGSSRTRVKGYDTATTAVVTDSEDDLFFLEGWAYFASVSSPSAEYV